MVSDYHSLLPLHWRMPERHTCLQLLEVASCRIPSACPGLCVEHDYFCFFIALQLEGMTCVLVQRLQSSFIPSTALMFLESSGPWIEYLLSCFALWKCSDLAVLFCIQSVCVWAEATNSFSNLSWPSVTCADKTYWLERKFGCFLLWSLWLFWYLLSSCWVTAVGCNLRRNSQRS